MSDKKLISAFRGFVQKVFLPNLKKGDPALNEWNRFSQMLASDTSGYEEISQYVDSLGSNNLAPVALDKRDIPLFKKRAQDAESTSSESAGFNPSKTFGGERARMMFMKGGEGEELGEPRQGGFGFGRNDDLKRGGNNAISPQVVLPGLQRLCKTFLQNQGRIQNMLAGIKTAGKFG